MPSCRAGHCSEDKSRCSSGPCGIDTSRSSPGLGSIRRYFQEQHRLLWQYFSNVINIKSFDNSNIFDTEAKITLYLSYVLFHPLFLIPLKCCLYWRNLKDLTVTVTLLSSNSSLLFKNIRGNTKYAYAVLLFGLAIPAIAAPMDEGRERDNTSRRGGPPMLPGLYLCTIQPSQRGFFRVHTFVWREREPVPEFTNFSGPQASIPRNW